MSVVGGNPEVDFGAVETIVDSLRSSWTEMWWIGEKPGQKSEHKEPDSHYGNHPPKRLLVFALVERPVTRVYFALFYGYEQLPGKIADQQIQN